MPDPVLHPLCDICRQAGATEFIDTWVCDGDKGSTSTLPLRKLCATCLSQSEFLQDQAMKDYHERLRNGECKYCGRPAAAGNSTLRCEACQKDWAEFGQRPENKLAMDFDHGDNAARERFIQQLQGFSRRQEEYMRQKRLERASEHDPKLNFLLQPIKVPQRSSE